MIVIIKGGYIAAVLAVGVAKTGNIDYAKERNQKGLKLQSKRETKIYQASELKTQISETCI